MMGNETLYLAKKMSPRKKTARKIFNIERVYLDRGVASSDTGYGLSEQDAPYRMSEISSHENYRSSPICE